MGSDWFRATFHACAEYYEREWLPAVRFDTHAAAMRRDPFALYREGRVRPSPGDAAHAGADASAGRGTEAARKEDKSSNVSGSRGGGGTGLARNSHQKAGDNPELSSHNPREILV